MNTNDSHPKESPRTPPRGLTPREAILLVRGIDKVDGSMRRVERLLAPVASALNEGQQAGVDAFSHLGDDVHLQVLDLLLKAQADFIGMKRQILAEASGTDPV